MELDQREVYYDHDLIIEAYHLSGIVQKFPNHFHEYYVIGFIEGGKRHLWCKGEEYDLSEGDLILFNPRDNHSCAPITNEVLDFRTINISIDVMSTAVKEITGIESSVHFSHNVVHQCDITYTIRDLYNAILHKSSKLEKEELLYFLVEQLLEEYTFPFEIKQIIEPDMQIRQLCAYIDTHYTDNLTLDDLVSMTSFSKSYLLRTFTRQIGVSPYRYLQTIRLNQAKRLLEQGITPIDTANITGFTDQSHFTNYFKQFIGITPKQYQRIFTGTVISLIKETNNE